MFIQFLQGHNKDNYSFSLWTMRQASKFKPMFTKVMTCNTLWFTVAIVLIMDISINYNYNCKVKYFHCQPTLATTIVIAATTSTSIIISITSTRSTTIAIIATTSIIIITTLIVILKHHNISIDVILQCMHDL